MKAHWGNHRGSLPFLKSISWKVLGRTPDRRDDGELFCEERVGRDKFRFVRNQAALNDKEPPGHRTWRLFVF
jgi:hypothetical protein